ncbi:MAG: TRAP transporter permease [Thioalkalivibrionaceae bacterium]
MNDQTTRDSDPSLDDDAQAVQDLDSGPRDPHGLTGKVIWLTAVTWSLFQVWIASPMPYELNLFIVSDTQARSIHLAFAVFLGFLIFPAVVHRLGVRNQGLGVGRVIAIGFYLAMGIGTSALAVYDLATLGRLGWVYAAIAASFFAIAWPLIMRPALPQRVPVPDWFLGAVAAACSLYLYLFFQDIAGRPGAPNTLDLIVAGVGIVLLLEATRRVLGPALMIIAAIFLFYTFAGPLMPDLIAHRGASYPRAMAQQWLSNEGVFGIALGVSTSFVFLFVLFGALLEKAGAGDYFIRTAFAGLGHLRGGPAKAAVIASGMTGVVSGSSIANVVTTGTFTIPLMRRVGFKAEKAGAVEVASSVNGQLMPPVMGAAAFLMVEYVGIPYVEVLKHALIPAIVAYVALFYIVHLEACKNGMEGLERTMKTTLKGQLITSGFTLAGIVLLAAAVYWGLGWIKSVAGDSASWIIAALVLIVYLGLLVIVSRQPEAEPLDTDRPLPALGPTVLSGLHFILPLVILVWALVVERLSPGLSAFWAVAFMFFILLTQRPILAMLRGEGRMGHALNQGVRELFEGLETGARNMIGIGIATAAAGIIVGTVAMTGVGLVLTDVVDVLSGGNLLVMLVLVALISLVLGLGLPTTANYIIVATLMAPVIVELGAQNDLLVPLIAAHLFVFYFGIMADVTPPVGLASFAAAAVARADPIMTGVHAFFYSLRTVALPFFFIFNPALLLVGVNSGVGVALVFFGALIGMLAFTAATMGWFQSRSRWYESVVLFAAAVLLLAPAAVFDRFQSPFEQRPPLELFEIVETIPDRGQLRLEASGLDLEGRELTRTVMFPLGRPDLEPRERLADAGLSVQLRAEEEIARIQVVAFGSPASRVGLEGGWEITSVLVPRSRVPAEILFLPALALIALVFVLQRRRADRTGRETMAST